MKLSDDFKKNIISILGDNEAADFFTVLDESPVRGLRINTLKISVENAMKILPFRLEPVPWCRDGFYFDESENPGKHPLYHSGLYYIQEPSAMLPVEILKPLPGECVLDLCAAPGGKTVQIAAKMNNTGILVANEVNSERARPLIKNLELCGVRNSIVLNEDPQKLACILPGFFDKILVDAPCSGQGMFRKEGRAIGGKSIYRNMCYDTVQREILDQAGKMLKAGGLILYSTCTFSEIENESVINGFLSVNPEFELAKEMSRIWPHKTRGEGHFAALLRKNGAGGRCQEGVIKANIGADHILSNAFFDFAEKTLTAIMSIGNPKDWPLMQAGSNLYCLPEGSGSCVYDDELLMLDKLKTCDIKALKYGLYLGNFSRGRFTPSHSLAMALCKEDFLRTVDMSSDDINISKYLKGETLIIETPEGLTAVCADGFVLGWGMQSGGTMKNLYPKGWRKLK
jgi:NOL1/NOP2/sun family putative RNA methylase